MLEGRGGGEYWFLVDARGRIARTGAGSVAEARAALGPDVVDAITIANVEVGGHAARVVWIRLKG